MSKECDGRNLRNGKARWQALLLKVVVKVKLKLEKRDGDSEEEERDEQCRFDGERIGWNFVARA